MKEIKKLNPFGKLCVNFGMIPSSLTECPTFEEQLLFFCDFLENKVIPTVNNNADAIIELQSYVKNYFDNLDVQDEINEKLNNMAKDGTLINLISNYIDPIITPIEERLDNKIETIESKVDSAVSGSPAGVYNTLQNIIDSDPDHSKIYITLNNGHWAYFNREANEWQDGGVYQATSFPEVDDIKNGAFGKKYSSPGNAVRKQIIEANQDLVYLAETKK